MSSPDESTNQKTSTPIAGSGGARPKTSSLRVNLPRIPMPQHSLPPSAADTLLEDSQSRQDAADLTNDEVIEFRYKVVVKNSKNEPIEVNINKLVSCLDTIDAKKIYKTRSLPREIKYLTIVLIQAGVIIDDLMF